MVALIDADDPCHTASTEFVRTTSAQLLSTVVCLTEAMFILKNVRAQSNLLAWIQAGGVEFEEFNAEDFGRISELLQKYADRSMDFADAAIVALCERLDVPHVATFDSDFTIYRFKGRRHFINVMK